MAGTNAISDEFPRLIENTFSPTMNNVAVYCGSAHGDRPDYLVAAGRVGKLLADNDLGLVYGGAAVGLMGAVADSYISAGGKHLVGVVPEQFSRIAHPGLNDLHVTETMHQRKQLMFELADGFIILPGGLGTLDETIEVLEWARLGMHSKPVGLLNTADYYSSLLAFLAHMTASKFCSQADQNLVLAEREPEDLIGRLRSYRAPVVERWWTTVEAGARLAAQKLPPFNPRDEQVMVDPYPVYAQYRKLDPVHWGKPYKNGSEGCWYLFRHEDVVSVLKDRRMRRVWPMDTAATRMANAPTQLRPFWEVFDRLLLSTDPPAHRRLRALVSKAFTPAIVESYRPLIRQTADQLATVCAGRGEFDVITDYAVPLSFTVICDILGIPPADSAMLRSWITQFGAGLDLGEDVVTMAAASQAADQLSNYFGALVARRRSSPGPDVISALIAARDGGDQLREDELLGMCVQLVFAGHETTVGQIGMGILGLLSHPDQLARVREYPALIGNAVRESLRFNGSVQTAAARKPIEDVTVGGTIIRAGEPIIAFLGSANRDPAVFLDPDTFDITRDNSAAVAFGAGIHYCLGAALAQVEAELAISSLLRILPDLQLRVGHPPMFRFTMMLAGLQNLPVTG